MAIFLSDYLPDADDSSRRLEVARGLGNAAKHGHSYELVELEDIDNIFRPRQRFSHKGTYGHALIIAGAENTMGAALIAANACLHAGAGLTTLSMPSSGLTALNTALPEVMYRDRRELEDSCVFEGYNIIAIGPGLGKDQKILLEQVLVSAKPVVLDADALGILAEHPELLNKITAGSILTPHMKEFDRLFGEHANWSDRLNTGILKAIELGVVIVLKNERTFIIDQKGMISINPTGNPAMAQGGMGDALTGIIAALVAQGYDAKSAAILGVYVHGKAGDELAGDKHSVTASELILQLSNTIKQRP